MMHWRGRRWSGELTDYFWMVFGLLGLLFGLFMALVAVTLQKKNRQYLDTLIDLSERLPEEDGDLEEEAE